MGDLLDRVSIIPRRRLSDERGWFLKIIDGKELCLPNHTGEIYTVSALPNESRGGHYHKKAVEWFTIIAGNAALILEDVESRERTVLELCESEPVTVFVPQNIAHMFVNTGDMPFILIAYTDVLYDPSDTISFKIETNNE